MSLFKGKKKQTDDFEGLESLEPSNILTDIAELLKLAIELLHSKREEVFIERYATGYTYATKQGQVYFKSYEQTKRELDSMKWKEPEPAPQLTPFEQLALPGVPTKHHL